MSELEKKDEARIAAEEAEKQRQNELHAGTQGGKKKGEPEVAEEPTTGLSWDSEIDSFFERMKDFSGHMGMVIGSNDFRTLVLYYREHTVMEKRVIANRLQRMGMHSFLRALHAGDYRMYQDTWQAEADALRNPNPSAKSDET